MKSPSGRQQIRRRATVESSSRLTSDDDADVREIVLRIVGRPMAFEPGQCISIPLPQALTPTDHDRLRFYNVNDLARDEESGEALITIAVKRCFFVDRHGQPGTPGLTSNFLCDLEPGQAVVFDGPCNLPFPKPHHDDAAVFLIATSTGIAPFRAFVRQLNERAPAFRGKIRMFHLGEDDLELVYLGDARRDFKRYDDLQSFEAYRKLWSGEHWTDDIRWSLTEQEATPRLWALMGHSRSHVYIAGLRRDRPKLVSVLAEFAGSELEFEARRAEMHMNGRWVEQFY
ncbi:MAG: hypothetical protein KC502_13730 [Myxococcales bacterium]|nr:hypothetical protein [Myxococcales bacterium]